MLVDVWKLSNFSKSISQLLKSVQIQEFATSSVVNGRKSRDPYDRRFGIRPPDAAPHKPGGSIELLKQLGRGEGMPQPPGVYARDGKFHLVEDMIPEFVVPDLTDFKLKPYVSYRCTDIKQSEFTAKDLFDAAIAKDIIEDFQSGKIDLAEAEKKIEKIKLKTNS